MEYGYGEQTMFQKLKLMKQIHHFKKGFVIFLIGATFRILLRLDYKTTNP